MADVELRSLRVSAQMDASQYVAGTKKMEDANKSLVASTQQVGSNVVQMETKISQSVDVWGRLSKQYIDGTAAQQRFASGLRDLQKGLDTGKISIEQASNVLVGMNQKLGLTGDVTALVAKGQTSLAEAMSMANTTIAAQQGTLSRAVGEWQIYIAQLKEAQAAQNSTQFASANQNKFNALLGVQTQPSSSARESASAFTAGFADMDQIAQLKARQIGQNFSDNLDRSLIAGTSKAARDAASVFSTEFDRIDALAQLKATQIGANFQSDLNASFGIGAGGGAARASASVFEEAGREADQMAAKVAALRAEINPLAAAQDRLNAELAEYSSLAAKGAISAEELGRAQALARNRAANQNNMGGLNRFGAMNATSQFQDIAVTAAMGQSPMTIALQQGTQLGMAMQMQMGDQGAKGVVKGLGTAFMGLLSPINLLAIGLAGVAAIAIQFGSKLLPQIKSLKEATEDQRKAVTDLAEAYGAAGLKADDFYQKSVIASESEARRKTLDLQKSLDKETDQALRQLTTFNTPGRSAGGFFGVTSADFKPFNDVIQAFRQTRDFDQLEKGVAGTVSHNSELRATGDRILEIAAAGTAAWHQLHNTAEAIKDINRSSVGNFDRTQQAGQAQSVMNQRFGDDPFAQAREQQRQKEIALTEAQNERKRSLDRTLDSARLDIDLVGKTTAEVEGLRMAAQLEAQVREEAAKNNVAVDQAEIALIRQKAAEYGKLVALQQARSTIFDQSQDIELQKAELGLIGQSTLAHDRAIASLKAEQEIRRLGIDLYGKEANEIRKNTAELSALAEASAKAKIQQDLLFDIRQAGRSQQDQSVASQLRSLGLPEDLDSDIAKVIKMKDQIAAMKDTWNEVFQTARDGIDGVVDALFDGGSIGDALKKAGRDFARQMFDLAATDPLKNWLTGSNLNTIADMGIFGSGASSGKGGGFGGVLGNLLGAQKAVASMQVQAASVFINGAPIGVPGVGSIGSLLNPTGGAGFKPDTTLTDLLTGGGANQNTIQSRIDQAFGTGGLGGIFSPTGTSSMTGSMSAYASAIKAIESAGSGGYSALGPMLKSGDQALGAYQVMKSNLPSWSKEAFGSTMSPSQFMSNPAAQDAVFNQQFGKLLGKYGNSNDAASAWFTGGPLSTRAGATDVLGTSGSQYVDKFNAALEKVTGTTSSLTNATGTAAQGLGSLGSGLSQFGSNISSFMSSASGGGSSWFQGLSSIFGGASGAISSMNAISPLATADILSGSWGLFHEGGVAGYPRQLRSGVDPRVFIGAPRYHNGGIAGDEVPAILKRGEPVFKSMEHARQVVGGNDNGNMEAMLNAIAKKLSLTVKNINVFDPSVVGDYMHTDDGEKATQNVMRRTGSGRASLG